VNPASAPEATTETDHSGKKSVAFSDKKGLPLCQDSDGRRWKTNKRYEDQKSTRKHIPFSDDSSKSSLPLSNETDKQRSSSSSGSDDDNPPAPPVRNATDIDKLKRELKLLRLVQEQKKRNIKPAVVVTTRAGRTVVPPQRYGQETAKPQSALTATPDVTKTTDHPAIDPPAATSTQTPSSPLTKHLPSSSDTTFNSAMSTQNSTPSKMQVQPATTTNNSTSQISPDHSPPPKVKEAQFLPHSPRDIETFTNEQPLLDRTASYGLLRRPAEATRRDVMDIPDRFVTRRRHQELTDVRYDPISRRQQHEDVRQHQRPTPRFDNHDIIRNDERLFNIDGITPVHRPSTHQPQPQARWNNTRRDQDIQNIISALNQQKQDSLASSSTSSNRQAPPPSNQQRSPSPPPPPQPSTSAIHTKSEHQQQKALDVLPHKQGPGKHQYPSPDPYHINAKRDQRIDTLQPKKKDEKPSPLVHQMHGKQSTSVSTDSNASTSSSEDESFHTPTAPGRGIKRPLDDTIPTPPLQFVTPRLEDVSLIQVPSAGRLPKAVADSKPQTKTMPQGPLPEQDDQRENSATDDQLDRSRSPLRRTDQLDGPRLAHQPKSELTRPVLPHPLPGVGAAATVTISNTPEKPKAIKHSHPSPDEYYINQRRMVGHKDKKIDTKQTPKHIKEEEHNKPSPVSSSQQPMTSSPIATHQPFNPDSTFDKVLEGRIPSAASNKPDQTADTVILPQTPTTSHAMTPPSGHLSPNTPPQPESNLQTDQQSILRGDTQLSNLQITRTHVSETQLSPTINSSHRTHVSQTPDNSMDASSLLTPYMYHGLLDSTRPSHHSTPTTIPTSQRSYNLTPTMKDLEDEDSEGFYQQPLSQNPSQSSQQVASQDQLPLAANDQPTTEGDDEMSDNNEPQPSTSTNVPRRRKRKKPATPQQPEQPPRRSARTARAPNRLTYDTDFTQTEEPVSRPGSRQNDNDQRPRREPKQRK
jgi:hypothetical protein